MSPRRGADGSIFTGSKCSPRLRSVCHDSGVASGRPIFGSVFIAQPTPPTPPISDRCQFALFFAVILEGGRLRRLRQVRMLFRCRVCGAVGPCYFLQRFVNVVAVCADSAAESQRSRRSRDVTASYFLQGFCDSGDSDDSAVSTQASSAGQSLLVVDVEPLVMGCEYMSRFSGAEPPSAASKMQQGKGGR